MLLLLPANSYFRSIVHRLSLAFQKGVIRGVKLGIKYMGADRGGSGGLVVNVASMAGNTFSHIFFSPPANEVREGDAVQTCSLCGPYFYRQAGGWPSTKNLFFCYKLGE